jgi:hypothetical protein
VIVEGAAAELKGGGAIVGDGDDEGAEASMDRGEGGGVKTVWGPKHPWGVLVFQSSPRHRLEVLGCKALFLPVCWMHMLLWKLLPVPGFGL